MSVFSGANVPLRTQAMRSLLLALTYYGSARLGLWLQPTDGPLPLIWPPPGVALAGVVLWGEGVWPGVFLGAFGVHIGLGVPALWALPVAGLTTLASGCASVGLTGWLKFRSSLERTRDVLAFVGLGVVGFALLTSLADGVSAHFGPWQKDQDFVTAFPMLWSKAALGTLIFAPPLLLGPALLPALSNLRWYGAELLGFVSVLLLFVWASANVETALSYPRSVCLFLGFPLLLWAAMRFAGAIVGTLMAGLAIALSTIPDFHRDPIELASYLATLTTLSLFLVALRTESRTLHRALLHSEARLRAAFDHLPFDFWICDQDRRYTLLNASFIKQWGDHRGARPEESGLPEAVRSRCTVDDRLALSGQVVQNEVTFSTNGQERTLVRILAPVRVGEAIEGLVGVSLDITEHKRAQEAITVTLERLKFRHAAVVELSRNPAIQTGDLRTVAEAMTEKVAHIGKVNRVGLWLLRSDDSELRCVDLFDLGLQRHVGGFTIDLRSCPSLYLALRRDRTIEAHDAQSDPRTTELCAEYLRPYAITSMLDAPIRVDGQVVAVLRLEHQGPLRTWSADEVAFAAEVADLFVIAWVNMERRKAEVELARHRDHLEELVSARTVDLEQANLGLTHEVAVRMHTEAALRASEQQFRSLVEMAPVVIVHLKPDGEILEFNPEAERVFGCKRTEVIGKKYAELFMKEEWIPAVVDAVRKVMTGVPMRAFECPILTMDRRERTYAWFSHIVSDADGVPSGIVHVGQDITEQKEVERQLVLAKEAAEAADRIKSVFLATMSHELRTPLNSIIGFTGILQQGLSGPVNERQQDQLRRVYGSAKHLLALITDVMDISKIEAGRVEIIPETFRLRQLIDQALDQLRPQALENDLALLTSVSGSIELTTDKRRLLQCLINIIGNAVKYTSHGQVRVEASERGAYVDIDVSDTGIGIDAVQQAKLFKPFERLNSDLLAKVPGTGLGLYLTKKIAIELLRGGISVESRLGVGSRFTLTVAKSIPAEFAA